MWEYDFCGDMGLYHCVVKGHGSDHYLIVCSKRDVSVISYEDVVGCCMNDCAICFTELPIRKPRPHSMWNRTKVILQRLHNLVSPCSMHVDIYNFNERSLSKPVIRSDE